MSEIARVRSLDHLLPLSPSYARGGSESGDDVWLSEDDSSPLVSAFTSMVSLTGVEAGRKKKIAYTIGCFDLFHRGHGKLFERLRDRAHRVVVGVHDCESITLLKKRAPIDSTEVRVANVLATGLVDEVFVVRGTDPTPFLEAAIDKTVPKTEQCFLRGDDMPQFPGRAVAEEYMEIVLLPYTEGVSSTMIRAQLLAGQEKEN